LIKEKVSLTETASAYWIISPRGREVSVAQEAERLGRLEALLMRPNGKRLASGIMGARWIEHAQFGHLN